MTDKPAHQLPELAEFWDHRFKNGVTPWESEWVPAALQEFAGRVTGLFPTPEGVDGDRSRPRVLIPGCGSARDAAWLDRLGWSVVALDFSAAALERARAHLSSWSGTLVHADFFTHRADPAYDLIYERAFLCALPRKLWPGYGPQMARLLVPGGMLAGFFILGEDAKGPPFPIAREQLHALLDADFQLIESRPVESALPVFAGREYWLVWRRRLPAGAN